MQFTFRQACTALASYAHDHSEADLASAINSAVLSLSTCEAWDHLRKVMRVRVAGNQFSLPQDAASVVRACVNGTPSTMLGQDFRFLSSGPGDLETLPTGFHYLDPGVVDLGVYPTMFDLRGPSHLVAYLNDSVSEYQPDLVVTGHLENGELKTIHLAPAKTEGISTSPGQYISIDRFTDIVSVVIDGRATAYIYLYAAADQKGLWFPKTTGQLIGQYHPEVVVPELHRYLIPGAKPDKVYELLLEVQVAPLPLVEPTDILPFGSLEPVRYAMLANRYFDLGEVDAGTKYRELAIGVLMQAERARDKKQTFVVNNMLYPNSLGEMSDQYKFL